MVLFAFSPQVLYFSGMLESMSITARFVFIFTVNGISQVFFIAYIILLDSMLSDVIDEHELHSEAPEEGLFFAARSFATKASYGSGQFLRRYRPGYYPVSTERLSGNGVL